jgi:hypothetical protein
MKRFKYIYHQEFRGSIRGVNRFLKPGDILRNDDIQYFQNHYPDHILDITETKLEPPDNAELLKLISDQSQKLDALVDIVKTGISQPQYVVRPNGFIETPQETISMKEDSIATLMKVDTSEIESQGTVGETVSQGISVTDKIRQLKERLSAKS